MNARLRTPVYYFLVQYSLPSTHEPVSLWCQRRRYQKIKTTVRVPCPRWGETGLDISVSRFPLGDGLCVLVPTELKFKIWSQLLGSDTTHQNGPWPSAGSRFWRPPFHKLGINSVMTRYSGGLGEWGPGWWAGAAGDLQEAQGNSSLPTRTDIFQQFNSQHSHIHMCWWTSDPRIRVFT